VRACAHRTRCAHTCGCRNLLTYTKAAVTRNKSEKAILSILDTVSHSNNRALLHEFYDTTLDSLREAQNEVLLLDRLTLPTLFRSIPRVFLYYSLLNPPRSTHHRGCGLRPSSRPPSWPTRAKTTPKPSRFIQTFTSTSRAFVCSPSLHHTHSSGQRCCFVALGIERVARVLRNGQEQARNTTIGGPLLEPSPTAPTAVLTGRRYLIITGLRPGDSGLHRHEEHQEAEGEYIYIVNDEPAFAWLAHGLTKRKYPAVCVCLCVCVSVVCVV
jgi:hypothetical protein